MSAVSIDSRVETTSHSEEYALTHQGTSHALQQLMRMLSLSIIVLIFVSLSVLYFWNLLEWSIGPDFGWTTEDNIDGLVVLSVHGRAESAGLMVGDLIVGINWKEVSTISDAQKNVDRTLEGTNIYDVMRNGSQIEIIVPNKPLGFLNSFERYGVTWMLGGIFFVMGAVVFFMKPDTAASWAFLACMFITGLYITYTITSKLQPNWLAHIIGFTTAFLAAPIIHLTQVFPEEKGWLRNYRQWFLGLPYLVSLVLFIAMLLSAPQYADVPVIWKKVCYIYLFSAIMAFVGSTLNALFQAKAANARARAKVILGGLVIGAGIPVANAVSVLFLKDPLLPHVLFVLLFYSILPIAIGYAIVKHNLFDVDAYVKRTVGYAMMTVILAGGYLLLQSGVRYVMFEPVFGDAAEHVYPVLYAILVVFLFNPVNSRIQLAIDKLFYRKQYDFKEVVEGVENSLSSVLDINERMKRLVSTLKNTLFLESAGMVVYEGLSDDGRTYFEISGEDEFFVFRTSEFRIRKDNPLMRLIVEKGRMITRFDLEEDKRFSKYRNTCIDHFDNLDASIGIPLIHNSKTLGVLFMGGKRSGKFFNEQDIDLAKMLCIRGAVAIDNAQLVEQMRKEEEVRSNLARYLSPQIVDRVVSNDMQVNLGGQRKEVSVLFSDIRGFTTISETWPPDQLVTILNEYMTEMVAVVFENKGSIDKFVGDAIVAVFGSLVEVENHARHAVNAAIGMQRRLVDLNIDWKKRYGVELGIGIGINTGEVFLGNIGSPERMEFTVIGDAVNLAARLEGLTKFYGVELVVSEFTRRGLDDILCRKLDLVRVKGKHKAVAIYEPVCLVMDADDRLQSELSGYDEALSAYYQQQWAVADEAFGALASQYPDKKLYTLYRDRIAGLRRAGLPAEWDGVFVHTTK